MGNYWATGDINKLEYQKGIEKLAAFIADGRRFPYSFGWLDLNYMKRLIGADAGYAIELYEQDDEDGLGEDSQLRLIKVDDIPMYIIKTSTSQPYDSSWERTALNEVRVLKHITNQIYSDANRRAPILLGDVPTRLYDDKLRVAYAIEYIPLNTVGYMLENLMHKGMIESLIDAILETLIILSSYGIHSHGDLHEANILYDEYASRAYVIDYEFSSLEDGRITLLTEWLSFLCSLFERMFSEVYRTKRSIDIPDEVVYNNDLFYRIMTQNVSIKRLIGTDLQFVSVSRESLALDQLEIVRIALREVLVAFEKSRDTDNLYDILFKNRRSRYTYFDRYMPANNGTISDIDLLRSLLV